MKSAFNLILCGLCFAASTACAEITVGAAISMGDAIEEISAAYTDKTGKKIRHTFAGTNVISRQIEAGAPIDVFISADSATMDGLRERKLVVDSTVVTVASNRLVVVVPADSKRVVKNASDLEGFAKIAIADPQSVPAGIYAKKWLTGENLWALVSPKTIALQNVRAALLAVETGNADAGIVYRTDALSSRKVRVVFSPPLEKTGAIEYPAAVVAESPQQEEAKRFIEFLAGEAAGAVFVRHGFGKP